MSTVYMKAVQIEPRDGFFRFDTDAMKIEPLYCDVEYADVYDRSEPYGEVQAVYTIHDDGSQTVRWFDESTRQRGG